MGSTTHRPLKFTTL
jgi:hypothetical protein